MSDLSSRRNVHSVASRPGDDINYTKEAFKNGWNLAFVGALVLVVASIVLSGSASLGLAALGVGLLPEVGYLFMAQRNERFRRAVRSRKRSDRRRPSEQQDIYRRLSRRSQRRYADLRQLEDAIEANYRKLSSASQSLLESHLRKIDGLLEAHLNLLDRSERYLDHTEAATESEVRRSIAAVTDRLEEASPRVREVKERRLRILKQRLRRFHEGHENREVIDAQLQTIEDVVRYIHEQSWTLQNPDEITHQLDTLLDEVEETQLSVQAVEEVYTRSPDELLDELGDLEGSKESARRRDASRQRG